MIELPFKLNFTFDFTDDEQLQSGVFENTISEIKEIFPTPNVKIYVKDDLNITAIQNLFKALKFELNIIYTENTHNLDFVNEKCNLIIKTSDINNLLGTLNKIQYSKYEKIIIEHSRSEILSEIGFKNFFNKLNEIKNASILSNFAK